MCEQVFGGIGNALRKEAGCSIELDYVEQISQILFLHYLEEHEQVCANLYLRKLRCIGELRQSVVGEGTVYV